MSMLYPAMNKLTEYIPNRYMMVNVVARRARQIADEAEETARVFDLLLGDNLSGRKDYIAENGCRYLDMIDVS